MNQGDMFVADLVDVPIKGEMSTMEFPLFSLATKPDKEIYRYDNPKTGDWLEIIPSVRGRATQHDKDVLLFAMSQIVEGLKRGREVGREVGRKVQITAHEFLVATGRSRGGKAYDELLSSLERLRGTTFKAGIERLLDGKTHKKGEVFGLIDSAKVISANGRMVAIDIELGERIFLALGRHDVLTYSPEYYGLRSPMTRRLYELCRKHCGKQPIWEIGLEKLHDKVGSRASRREFRRQIVQTVKKQPIPDYMIDYQRRIPGKPGTEKVVVMLDLDGELREELAG